MKKTLVVLVSLLLALAMMTACGAKTDSGDVAEDVEQAAAASAFSGTHVVSADYVKENIDNILLYDARGEEAAAEGTIAQAVPVAWQYFATCEDGATGDANWGCILDPERLSARLGEKGFDKNKEIVLFAAADQGWGDDGRIAWELIAAGYTDVKVVDGGYNALVAAGLETAKGGAEPVAVEVTVEDIDQTHVINTDELVKDYDQYKVVDVRADEEYNGEVLYGEANGGHLPGAVHVPFTELFDENGMLKSNEDLTAMFEAAGLEKDDKIVTYCTAGIRSAFEQLILEDCGYGNVKNYDESFYRWSAVQDVE